MKIYIFFMLVLFWTWQATFAQTEPGDFQSCPPLGENNNVITHALPLSFILPRHEEVLPRLEQNVNGGPDYRFWNTFEYWSKPGQNLIEEIPILDMGLNPGELYWDAMPWLNPYDPFEPYDWLAYQNTALNEMITPENGWELMSMNLGYFPNISPERIPVEWNGATYNMRGIPFMAFYNKYTSTFRVFFRRGNNESTILGGTDIAYLRARLVPVGQEGISGLLRHSGAYDQALDIPTTYFQAAAVCPNPGGAQSWFVGEFKIAYDPCICTKKSELAIDFEFVNTGKLDIQGVALGVTEDITAGGNLVNNDFFGAFNDIDIGDQQDGYLIYKQINSAIDEYIKKYEDYLAQSSAVSEHNKRVENNLKILKFAKLAIATAGAAFGVPSAVGAIAAIVPALISTDSAGSKWIKDKDQKDFWKKTDEVLEEAVKFFAGESMKNKEKPNAPFMPTVSTTEMKFKGELTYTTTNVGWRMQVPGSQDANAINPNHPNRYPLFNETLGSFAVLKTPKINVAEKIEDAFIFTDDVAQSIWTGHLGGPLSLFTQEWYDNCSPASIYNAESSSETGVYRNFMGGTHFQNTFVQLSLPESFSYAVNNLVPIKGLELEAQIVVKVKAIFKDNCPTWMKESGDHTNSWSKFKLGDFGIVNLYPELFDGSGTVQGEIQPNETHVIESPRLPIGALENLIMQFSLQLESFVPWSFQCAATEDYYTFHQNIPANFNPFQFLDFEYEFEVKFFAEIDYDVQYNQYNYGLVPTLNTSTGEYEYTIINTTDLVMHEVRTIQIPSNPITGQDMPTQTFVNYQPNSFIPNVWPGGTQDIGPANLTFYDTHFDGSVIAGCHLNGNQYLCKSWQEINVLGHLTVEPGYSVLIESASEINVTSVDLYDEINNESVYVGTAQGIVDPEIVLQINPNIININPSQPMEPEAVKSFCGANYLANHVSSLAPYNLEEDNVFEETEDDYQIEISLYPNPTNESSLVTFTLEEFAHVELYLSSISGQKMAPSVTYDASPGEFRHLVNLSSFENGVYLLVLQVNGRKYVKRLVKQ